MAAPRGTKAGLPARQAVLDVSAAIPDAVDPLALSLNEYPFPPLPAVQSAMTASIGAANRYPEFLPQRLRSLIPGLVAFRRKSPAAAFSKSGVPIRSSGPAMEPFTARLWSR